MTRTALRPARTPTRTQAEGLPVWYFVLAGSLVASFDISQQFSSAHPVVATLPLVLAVAHIALWFTVLSRRREFIRSVWRSRQARMLAVLLFAVRLGLQLVLTRVLNETAPLHSYAHLVMGMALLVLTTAGAWFDQWLILRTLNQHQEQTEER
ncbi:hypothetical protein OG205_13960 [Lentzea sp. NBC_00516]|uniref:hypothetical protein n=1 Tax=Lentzea sp. NBC_00516 TaxID=2903582 RepID=UPI002E8153A9|nr:hypothetical protein [Lentzea sp. NBC_00516]WUD28054.1 hypothetical protein OG205_13960 [Lentzea sp. NBC_00516]